MGFRGGGGSGAFRGKNNRGGGHNFFGNRGSGSGGGGVGGRGNVGRGGGGRNFDCGPPERVVPFGHFAYTCQDDLVCKVDIEDVPYFNAPIYLENKEQVGKVDEIFGTLRDYSISIKLAENMNPSSFQKAQKFFIDPQKLLPLLRFLPRPPQPKGVSRKKSGAGSNGGRAVRGGNRCAPRGRGFGLVARGGVGRVHRGGSGNRFSGGTKGFRGR